MKRTRRKRKANKLLLPFILIIILAVGLTFFAKSEMFNISTISVEGAETLEISDIIKLSNLEIGENIFDFRISDVGNYIRTELLVKNVSVSRVYPSKVVIKIVERTPYITVSMDESFYYLDEDGLVIEKSSDLRSDFGVILSGVSDIELIEGMFFNYNSNVNTLLAYEIADALSEMGVYHLISEIYISQSGYYYLYTTKANIIKFYDINSFNSNKTFITNYILNEDRHIIVEVIEDSEPVYKVIDIK